MLRLILFRHAKSEWPAGVPDHERPLGKRGRRTAPVMGAFLERAHLLPDIALVSTARRAIETWELALAACGTAINWKEEPRLYDAPVNALLDIVRQAPPDIRTLLLVGHNPGMETFAADLIAHGAEPDMARRREKFPTAGLAVIDFDDDEWAKVDNGRGALLRFATPKAIEDAA